MAELRFGFHDFLNAQPLLATLRKRESEGGYRLFLDSPAGVAKKFNAGELDLGMIPSVEYVRNRMRYHLLEHFAIVSRGPVDTVILILKKEPEKVERVSLDANSMTSSALTRILFKERFPESVCYQSFSGDPKESLQTSDAVLVIGDKAFSARRKLSDHTIIDLSEEWFRQTGKPFVHAVVAVHQEKDVPQSVLNVLEETQFRVNESISKIVKSPLKSLELTSTECENYLRNKIDYTLDKEALAGLEHFGELFQQEFFLNN